MPSPRAVHTNTPLPPTPGTNPKRRYHYIVERLDEGSDVDALAAALNDRAAQGYRFVTSHFYNVTGGVNATLVFERRLRRPRAGTSESGPDALIAPGTVDLGAHCAECGGEAVLNPRSVMHVDKIRDTGRCPNCDTPWPRTTPAPVPAVPARRRRNRSTTASEG